jgi:YHS domain-containing protein
MKMNLTAILLAVASVVFFSAALPSLAATKSEIYKNWRGVAIKGYDPVAYFTDGRPVEGSSKYELTWKDATWRFASAEHRDLFKADPEKYAPRYGGYCAWAVSQGSTASVDPQNAWKIIDGKLYLNYSVEVQKKWEQDIPDNIRKADANWPGVLK